MHLHIYTFTHLHSYTVTQLCIYACIYTFTHTKTDTDTDTDIYIYIYIYTYIYTSIHLYIYTYTYIHIYIHAYMHTCIHEYMNTFKQTNKQTNTHTVGWCVARSTQHDTRVFQSKCVAAVSVQAFSRLRAITSRGEAGLPVAVLLRVDGMYAEYDCGRKTGITIDCWFYALEVFGFASFLVEW